MEDEHPCPDCLWTTYLLTGRPVVILRCRACRNWFHCNIKLKTPGKSIAGPVLVADATINQTCTKEMLNSLLRCDCMAKQIYLSHIAHCDACRQSTGYGSFSGSTTHALRLLNRDTLHNYMRQMTAQVYKRSNLPAYTLQRRCGAVELYADRYVQEVATEQQAERTLAYRKKRQEIRNAHKK